MGRRSDGIGGLAKPSANCDQYDMLEDVSHVLLIIIYICMHIIFLIITVYLISRGEYAKNPNNLRTLT